MASLHECCCCVDGVVVPDRRPAAKLRDVMDTKDWNSQHGSSTKGRVRKTSISSAQRVHKKFSVLDSFDADHADDSVFVTDQPSTVLVLYCGGTIGMRSHHGGMDY